MLSLKSNVIMPSRAKIKQIRLKLRKLIWLKLGVDKFKVYLKFRRCKSYVYGIPYHNIFFLLILTNGVSIT